MIQQMFRSSAQALVVAIAALVCAAPAKAQIWSGSWDPLFGNPFLTTSSPPFGYNLGWGGGQGGTFFNVVVSAPCAVPPGGGDITNAGACGGSATITSLQVRLYDFDVGQIPIYNTLTFLTPPAIDQLRYGPDGKLKGISTPTWSDWVYDGAPLNIGTAAGTDAEFAIQFVLDGSLCLFCGLGQFPALDADYSGPVLFARIPLEDGDSCEGEVYVCYTPGEDITYKLYRSNVNDFPAVIAFVPEPGSLALLAGSLIGLAVGTRHRRAGKLGTGQRARLTDRSA
jgi:hypothetical protein